MGVQRGGIEDMEFPGVIEERACGNSHSSQLVIKKSGISTGVLRKTHVEFPWVFVF